MFHLCWSRKSFSFRPREASSAGLDLLLTYFHWLGSVLFLIVWTWFATKTWKRFWSLPMYLKTVVLSVQYVTLSDGSSMVNSFVISMFQTRTDVAAAVSSRRGMVVILTRASLAFPIRNAVMGLAFVVNQSQVWHLTVACGASISEVMDLPWDHPAEVLRLEASSHAKLFQQARVAREFPILPAGTVFIRDLFVPTQLFFAEVLKDLLSYQQEWCSHA